jgi:ribonuclease D
MTDKIYELIKQSEVSIGDIKCFTGHIDIDKFAELIVQECIDTAFHKGHPDLEFLLKHFGVEE